MIAIVASVFAWVSSFVLTHGHLVLAFLSAVYLILTSFHLGLLAVPHIAASVAAGAAIYGWVVKPIEVTK